MLINQFVPPIFTGINFRGMLHHACDVWPMTKTCVDQAELADVGAQID